MSGPGQVGVGSPDGNSPICPLPTHASAPTLRAMKSARGQATADMTVVVRDVRPDGRGRIALGRALKDLEDASLGESADGG